MKIRSAAGALVMALTLSILSSSPAWAKKKYDTWFSYGVPFTCGTSDAETTSVVPGEYATAITVTNLRAGDTRARAQVQLTAPVRSESDRIRREIPAGASFLIDCETILDGAFVLPVPLDAGSFYQGVLTIDSRARLQVIVQSTAAGAEGGISADTRQVTVSVIKRRRARDEDKDEVCHIPPGNPDNRHTIEVDASAVGAHLGHGDHRGECDDEDEEHDD